MFICQWLKAQHTTAYSPGSSITSQPTNFFTARLLWANKRPKVSLLPLPKEARNTMMHRSSRWLSAVSERLWRQSEWRLGQSQTNSGDETKLKTEKKNDWRIYLLPSWKSANSRAVLSSTVRAVTVTGPLALLGKQPCSLTSCQSEWILQMSTESKYLQEEMDDRTEHVLNRRCHRCTFSDVIHLRSSEAPSKSFSLQLWVYLYSSQGTL